MYQHVMIIGRLGKDPVLRTANSGKQVAQFTVAVSEKRGENESTEWFNVVAFGNTAEACGRYIHKGSLVYVEGKLKTRTYEKDGQTRYITELLADKVQFLDKKEGGSQTAAQNNDMDDLPF